MSTSTSLTTLPQLTNPTEGETLILVQDSGVNQYITVPQAQELIGTGGGGAGPQDGENSQYYSPYGGSGGAGRASTLTGTTVYYGGGGGGGDNSTDTGGAGGQGACRLIWGIGRIYPLSDYSTGSLNHG